MQKLIKDGKLTNDRWILVKEASNEGILSALPFKSIMVPLRFWKLYQSELEEYTGEVTIWLDSNERLADIPGNINQFPLIALNFPIFSDGRSYTNARELRESYGYEGEIRAIGDVLRDQIYYMHRCGFNAFSLRFDQDTEACLSAFNDFTTGYQASIDQHQPLFRRR